MNSNKRLTLATQKTQWRKLDGLRNQIVGFNADNRASSIGPFDLILIDKALLSCYRDVLSYILYFVVFLLLFLLYLFFFFFFFSACLRLFFLIFLFLTFSSLFIHPSLLNIFGPLWGPPFWSTFLEKRVGTISAGE